MKIIIGIDPGRSGAMAVWSDGIEKAIKCPSSSKEMADIIKSIGNKNDIAYVERVWARPSKATRAAFTFGVNYGEWLGILSTLNIDTVHVTPQTWMKYYKEVPKYGKDIKQCRYCSKKSSVTK